MKKKKKRKKKKNEKKKTCISLIYFVMFPINNDDQISISINKKKYAIKIKCNQLLLHSC